MKKKLFFLLCFSFVLWGCSVGDDIKLISNETEKQTVYLESISGHILPMEGESELSLVLETGFADRQAAGHVMTVQIGFDFATYVFSKDKWVPLDKALYFYGTEPVTLKASISSNGTQDGTELGILSADELIYESDYQRPTSAITNAEFRHTKSLVEFTFREDKPSRDVLSYYTKERAYANERTDTYTLLVPSSGQNILLGYNVVGEKRNLVGAVRPSEGIFESGYVYKEFVEENLSWLPEMPECDDFISYTGPFLFNKGGYDYQIISGAYVSTSEGLAWKYMEENVRPADLAKLDIYSSNLGVRFSVEMHETNTDQWQFDQPDKVLVASDFHGQLGAMVDLFRYNGVMDEYFNWTYGTNYVVVIGDSFDRGRDDLAILWLSYKLEKEAEEAGGKFIYVVGNHDDLVLWGDLRYPHAEHLSFAEQYGMSFDQFFSTSTELGKWLRNRNLVVTVGRHLFVHGGISTDFIENDMSIDEINQLSKEFLGIYPRSGRSYMVFRSSTPPGLLWYRGMANQEMSNDDVDLVLDYYDVDRVIIGHTEVNDIAWYYDGRVIPVNVQHVTNWNNRYKTSDVRKSGGLLIEGDNYFAVDYRGNKVPLN